MFFLGKKISHGCYGLTDARGLLFKHPSNFYICGPSQSGMTEFVKKLIKHKELMFDIPPQQIVWCYKGWQTAYSQLQEHEKIKFLRGIPDQDEDLVTDTGEAYLLVFDDMMGQDKDEEKIKLWFTRKGHHRNASVMYITQNLF